MHFHPGALIKNKWSCCSQRGKNTLGCQPTYHLLTRSSSRYAQMRRRDTLTSTSQRRPRNQSGPYSTLDRQSLATCSHVSDHERSLSLQGKPGQGLSNSCMNLTTHAPHRVESFIVDDLQSSQRSSRVSTDPSVGVGSITLTRVSMLETTPTGCDSDCNGHLKGLDSSESYASQLKQHTPKRHSRSQVAPKLETSAPVKQFPLCRAHPLEMEQKSLTLPKLRSKSRGESLESKHCVNSMDLAHERSPPPPVPPPRHRRRSPTTANTLTGSVHYIPTVRPINEAVPPPPHHGNESHNDVSGVSNLGKIKHSHTFVVQQRMQTVGGAIEHHMQTQMKNNYSQSTSALSKPMIEPKFSLTNPNVVHV